MEVIFSIVLKRNENTKFFTRTVEWPDSAPLPRVGEKVTLGKLFPCEITHIFWEIENEANTPTGVHIMTNFSDAESTLYEAVEEGYLKEMSY